MKRIIKGLALTLAALLGLQGTALALTPAIVPPPQAWRDRYQSFSLKIASQYLQQAEQDNQIVSPMSLYLALGMLAEGAREQTLTDLQTLLAGAAGSPFGPDMAQLWDSAYLDGDIARLIPANSLWMNESMPLKEAYIQAVRQGHHAEMFSEDFADSALSERIKAWASRKTEGLIQVELQPSPADMMMLINALYFQDKWLIPFAKAYTQADVFHLADGGEKPNVPYMHRLDRDTDYVRGEGFLRADLALTGGGKVSLILPDEGITPADLAGSPERLNEVLTGGTRAQGNVSWQVPRVDVKNSINMNDMLTALGLGSLFSGADLSGISDAAASVSRVRQDNRILLDEEEVKAASVTVIGVAMSAPMEKPVMVDMHLTRPYLMAIYARGGELAFIAAVNNP